ncbi:MULTISPECIES: WPE palindromic element domain-containing protein [unclassified Wolbachia]|uniref:WPE palindromic element domain-containing protein n=1 Tax=unclassified Wolbachia TaxID=2640676 RepID=UPI00223121FA|nr:WPE palindromic element domain-containing protein [Wolbachia endosymbiont (group A) of Apoderus coryli]
MSSQCLDYLDPEDLISTKWLHNKGWIPVPSTGMTAVLRHTAAVSLSIDPTNKQRDDGCQASCHPSAQTLGSRKVCL